VGNFLPRNYFEGITLDSFHLGASNVAVLLLVPQCTPGETVECRAAAANSEQGDASSLYLVGTPFEIVVDWRLAVSLTGS